MMYSTWYEKIGELSAFLKSLEVSFPVMHCEKHIGEKISLSQNVADTLRLFEINCRLANNIGAQKLVLHLWDGLTSDRNFENNLMNYPKLLCIAKSYSLDLLIENVVCNYKDPMLRWKQLVNEYSDVHFVFDTKMAAFHNQLDLLYSEEFSYLYKNNCIRHYHINDYSGGYLDWANLKTLPIGMGNIEFDEFFVFIKKTGYSDTFTIESTAFDQNGNIDILMLNKQFDYIRKSMC